jgi:molecular chaperone GrpE
MQSDQPQQPIDSEEIQENNTLDESVQLDINAEVNLLKDQLMRALAETENIRKRAEREKNDMSKYAVTNFAKDMLAISDNLSRALTALANHEIEDPKLKTLIDGIKLTEQTLTQVFERHGIKKIDPKGEKFDHNTQQAMSEIESDLDAGYVVDVYQPGYLIHDRLLRAAMVSVSKSK